MEHATCRTAAEVLEDHLQESQYGSIEDDLVRNYSEDLIVLIADGVFRGHDGLRTLGKRLRAELPDSTFEYKTQLVEGDVGFLEWRGRGGGFVVEDGADSYVIRDGKIVAQTIHYTVKPAPAD